MKKIYISGFESSIVAEVGTFLDIQVWMNQPPNCTHDINQLTSLDSLPPMESLKPFNHACYDYVYGHLPAFLDIYTRSFPYYEKTYHGLLNAFNTFYNYCYRLLVTNEIEYLILPNFPHEAVDFIVSKIAEYLNIPMLMCYQSPFPNRFWIVRTVSDFGEFSDTPNLSSNQHYHLKTNFEWFYMSRKNFQYGWRNFLSDMRRRPGIVPYALYKYKQAFDYRRGLVRCTIPTADMECKYVYFPLHLQPEMTTATLGGIYSDQMLALERLSEILPSDWLIYVKENPMQTDMQRNKGFFQRLAALKNVRMVPTQTNSMELIRASQFVATITGTAGWEAICVGKKSLVFGLPWYRCLPGVFQFTPDLNIADIISEPIIDPAHLEKAVIRVLDKAGVGVVDPAYNVLVDDLDIQKNALQVANTIRELLSSDTP